MSTFKKYLNIISEMNEKDYAKMRENILDKLDKNNNELQKKIIDNLKKGSDSETKDFIDDKILNYDKFMREELPSTLEEFNVEGKNLTQKGMNYLNKAIEEAIENLISNKFTHAEDMKMKKESSTSGSFKDLSETIIRFLYSEFNSKIKESNDFYTHYRISLKYIRNLVSEIIIDISDTQILKYYNVKELRKLNYGSLKKYIVNYLENNANLHNVLSKLITERFIKSIDEKLIKSIGSEAFLKFLLDNNKENLKKITLDIISEKPFGSVVEFKIEVKTNLIDYQNAYGRKTPKVSIGGHNRIEWLKKPQKEREAIENRNRDRKISREDSLRASVGSAKGQLAKENSGYYGDNPDYHRWKKEVGRRQKELNKYLKNK
jgi:hypothetical protein